MNTKKKGDVGLAHAVSYFGHKGMTVCLPLTDSQDYDLVVDTGPALQKVQVKMTSYQRNDNYVVEVAGRGGTKGGVYKKLPEFVFDLLFVYVASGDCYLIPKDKLSGCTRLTSKYDEYKVWRIGSIF